MRGRRAVTLVLPLLLAAHSGLAQENPALPDRPAIPAVGAPAAPSPVPGARLEPAAEPPRATNAETGTEGVEEEAVPATPQPDADTDSV